VSAAISRSGLVRPDEATRAADADNCHAGGGAGLAVTALSAFIKNVGALAIFVPIALQVARRTESRRHAFDAARRLAARRLITLIGTSPNVIVSCVSR
jgi:Na+/H+ antiporter NhaD/arsenite permease-like protein